MRLAIKPLREARVDVVEAAYYLANASNLSDTTRLRTSKRFMDAVEKGYGQLAAMPGMGTPRDYNNSAYAGMRMWPVPDCPKYLIFYRVVENRLQILRVLHGARDLDSIFAPPEE